MSSENNKQIKRSFETVNGKVGNQVMANDNNRKRKKRKINTINVTQIGYELNRNEKHSKQIQSNQHNNCNHHNNNNNDENSDINNNIDNNSEVINSDNDYYLANSSLDLNHNNSIGANDSRISSEKNRNRLSDAKLHELFPFLRSLTREDKVIAAEEGLTIKSGKYSKQEDNILRNNWQQFCDDFIVDIPHLVLGFFKNCREVSPEEKTNSKTIIKESQLHLRLAKGLPQRTVFSVYGRARKLFSGLNKSNDICDEDRKQILELYKKFGNQYSIIAQQFLCDIKTVTEVIRHTVKPNGKRIRHGYWDEHEEKQLFDAIQTVFRSEDLKLNYQNIPWSLVSTKMVNRSDVQCRQHFYSSMLWKIIHPDSDQINRWNSKYDSSKLIYFLYKNDYPNETDIDWDLLKEKFEDVVVFNKLTRNWYRLKTSVPDYHIKSYKEIVKWLYENKILKEMETESDWETLEEFCLT